MNLLKQQQCIFWIYILFMFICNLDSIIGEVILTEGEQIALESAETLLPDEKLVRKISIEIPRIRSAYANVSKIIHQSSWAPGELLAIDITDAQIQRLKKSKYGLVSYQKFDWGGAQLYFGYPYNPNNLKNILQLQYGFQSQANEYIGRTEKISYNIYRKEYTFEHGWGDCARGWPCLYTQYWVFREETDGIIRLVREGGTPDALSPPGSENIPSDVPQKTEPYPYAPNRKHSIQFGG